MQLPSAITSLFDAPGPFASVYLDASQNNEAGRSAMDLRWRGLRTELERSGADEKTLTALDEAVGGHVQVPGPRGQVLVARDGEVVLDAVTARPPVRELARWSPLPHLMPYLAARMTQVPYLLVLIDRTGADLTTHLDEETADHKTVEGSQTYPLHKTGRDTWDERHYQNRVDNAWDTNAADVARDIVKHLHPSVRLVLVAGEQRARTMVIEHLEKAAPQSVQIVQLDHGGRGEGSSGGEALDRAVHDALLHEIWRDRHEVLQRLQRGVGRQDFAVTGIGPVIETLRKAQLDTLVLLDDPSSTLEAFVGPGPLDLAMDESELRATGVDDVRTDRLDAALVRAVAGSGGNVLIMPGGHDIMTDGVGALLRYTDASTPR